MFNFSKELKKARLTFLKEIRNIYNEHSPESDSIFIGMVAFALKRRIIQPKEVERVNVLPRGITELWSKGRHLPDLPRRESVKQLILCNLDHQIKKLES